MNINIEIGNKERLKMVPTSNPDIIINNNSLLYILKKFVTNLKIIPNIML